eukprot:Gb_41509 [translate_table: standard]
MSTSDESSESIDAKKLEVAEGGREQGKIAKRLQTLHQRKEMLEEVLFSQREVNIRKEKTVAILSLFTEEPEVKAICQEIGLEYICLNCRHFDLELIEQFVKRVPLEGQQALQEKGPPSEFKNLVIKIAGKEALEGVRGEGLARNKLPDPWKGVATIIGGILLNKHLTNLFIPALRLKEQLETQRQELEECKADLSTALEKKRIEIALLRTEHTLREYGLTSPPLDVVGSSKVDGKGKALSPNPDVLSPVEDEGRPSGQYNNEIVDQLKLQLEEKEKDFEEKLSCKDKEIQELKDGVAKLETQLEGEEQRNKDHTKILKEIELKVSILEQRIQKEEVAEDAICEMVEREEKLQEDIDAATVIFQDRIRELKAKILIEDAPATGIPVNLADPRNDLQNLRVRLGQTEDRLNKVVEEYAFLENDADALMNLYEVAKPKEKNLLAEAFMTGFLVSDDLTFPINMVMGSVHIRAFMSSLQSERWRGEQITKYKSLLKEAPYEMRRNPGDWVLPPPTLERAFKEIHEYYLGELGGPEAYVERLRELVMEWHSNKHELWHKSVAYIQRMNEVQKDACLVTWEPWRIEIHVLQRFLKDIGENNLVCKTGWLGIPHNSEATRGELPGAQDLRDVMYHNTLTQAKRQNLASMRK